MTAGEYDKVLFGDTTKKTVDRRTAQMLEEAERRLGYTLTVYQGSYNTTVVASAKTHYGGGAVDLSAYDWRRKVKVLREIGFAAWYRPESRSWNAHIHAIDIGNVKAHQQAKDQVASYRRGRNGLVGDGPDNTPELRPAVIKAWVYKPEPPPKPKPKPQPKGVQFIDGHQSGLYSATNDEWSHGVNQLIARGATTVSLTEVRRDGIMPNITPAGWAFARRDAKPGQSECAIMWRTSVWDAASPCYSVLLTEKRYWRQGGNMAAPLYGLVQPLRHQRTGLIVLRAAVHLPSNIQGDARDVIEGPRPGEDPRELVTEDAIRNFGDLWEEGRSRHAGAARVVGADWNLDWRKDFVRQWWAGTFPLLTPAFEDRATQRGTHGNRVIDWTAYSPHFYVTGAEVLPATRKLDHKGVLVKGKILEVKR